MCTLSCDNWKNQSSIKNCFLFYIKVLLYNLILEICLCRKLVTSTCLFIKVSRKIIHQLHLINLLSEKIFYIMPSHFFSVSSSLFTMVCSVAGISAFIQLQTIFFFSLLFSLRFLFFLSLLFIFLEYVHSISTSTSPQSDPIICLF